jgi:hypothetical protein
MAQQAQPIKVVRVVLRLAVSAVAVAVQVILVEIHLGRALMQVVLA